MIANWKFSRSSQIVDSAPAAYVAKGSSEAILKAGDGKRGRNTRPTGGVQPKHFWFLFFCSDSFRSSLLDVSVYMAVGQNLVPLVNIKIAGKWMFIPLKMVLIGIDS